MDVLKAWTAKHPNLTLWFILAVGMIILVVMAAWDVGLMAMQWFWLVIITILVAGACIWIISWDDDDDVTESDNS